MSPSPKRTAPFWILNTLRGFSLLSLVLAMAAFWAVMVKSLLDNQFFFFDWITQFFFSLICGFLIISELSLADRWMLQTWPVFSRTANLVALGATQVFVGFHLLGSINEDWIKDEMGDGSGSGVFGKLLLGAGIVVGVVGMVNFVASFIFRRHTPTHLLTARQIRSVTYDLHSQPRHLGSIDLDRDLPQNSTYNNNTTPIPAPSRSYSTNTSTATGDTSKYSGSFHTPSDVFTSNGSVTSRHHQQQQQYQQSLYGVAASASPRPYPTPVSDMDNDMPNPYANPPRMPSRYHQQQQQHGLATPVPVRPHQGQSSSLTIRDPFEDIRFGSPAQESMIDGVHGRRSPGYGSIREPERAYSAGRKTWDEDQESIEAVRRGEVNRRQVVAASSVYSRDTDGRSYFQDGRYVYK